MADPNPLCGDGCIEALRVWIGPPPGTTDGEGFCLREDDGSCLREAGGRELRE